jgi:HrpA-like RNA helicase
MHRRLACSILQELVTVWTSQASAMQRSGRAGRMSEGICWRLFSEEFFNDVMIPQSAPEMVRTPLDELILQICLLFEQRRDENISKAETSLPLGVRPVQFLSKTPSPPPERSLLEGCRHLLEVDALHVVGASSNSTGEASYLYRLTPLGYHLSRLPMDTKVGKVLIVGCILGCLDGALTVAAALSCTKSCFCSLNPSNPENTAIVQHRSSLIENGFGGRSWAGGTVKGDLIAVIAAFRCWKKQESEGKRWKMVKSHGLDMTTLKDMDQLRSQFMQLLQDVGFVPKRSTASEMNSCLDLVLEDCNQSSEDALLTSCCLIGGLYPNICTLMRPRKGGPRGGRLLTKEGHVCRAQRNSFQSKRIQQATEVGRDAYAVFHAKQKTIGTSNLSSSAPDIFLTEVNFVSRFALMLFGGELQIVKNAVIVDDWLKFKICSRDDDDDVKAIENAVLIFSLREALDKVIVEHIQEVNACREQKQVMMERHKAIVQVVRKLLSEE